MWVVYPPNDPMEPYAKYIFIGVLCVCIGVYIGKYYF